MILDTRALLWLASGDKKLSRSALKPIIADIKLHDWRVVTGDERFAKYGAYLGCTKRAPEIAPKPPNPRLNPL